MASTISFSGLASGLDTSSWVEALVSAKQQKVTALQTDLKSKQTVKNTLNDTRSKFTTLRSAIEKLTDAKFGGAMDLFAKNSATSSDTDIFTATATSGATRQNYDITVQQLATYTKATSKNAASAIADDNTKLKNLGISDGTLTAYVNGQKYTVNINDTNTLGDLKAKLAGFGVKTNIDESGVLSFSAQNEGDTIHIGATTDSTNLTSLIGLTQQEDGSYKSTNSLFKATVASKLTSEDSGFNTQIKEGTFTIGGATFKITDKTTLSSFCALHFIISSDLSFDPSLMHIISISFKVWLNTVSKHSCKYFSILKIGIITDILIFSIISLVSLLSNLALLADPCFQFFFFRLRNLFKRIKKFLFSVSISFVICFIFFSFLALSLRAFCNSVSNSDFS